MKNVCLRCGRVLKNKLSVEKGYGPICESKAIAEYWAKRQITIDEVIKERNDNDRSGVADIK